MGTFWILITGVFYLFISLIFPLKKLFQVLYLIFGICIIVFSFYREIIIMKPLIIFFLYFPLIILGFMKKKIFK
jgi:hypothetical protein